MGSDRVMLIPAGRSCRRDVPADGTIGASTVSFISRFQGLDNLPEEVLTSSSRGSPRAMRLLHFVRRLDRARLRRGRNAELQFWLEWWSGGLRTGGARGGAPRPEARAGEAPGRAEGARAPCRQWPPPLAEFVGRQPRSLSQFRQIATACGPSARRLTASGRLQLVIG